MGKLVLLFSMLPGLLLGAAEGLLDIEVLADELGLAVETPSDGEGLEKILLRDPVRMKFTANSRIMELNGIRVFLGDPVTYGNNRLYLAVEDWEKTLRPILQPQLYPEPPAVRRIVIDAGHGGKDPGAQNPGAGMKEKYLALDLANRVGRGLRAAGFEVIFTRADDRFIPLEKRPIESNRIGADLFLSLHFNAARPDVRGVETFVYTLQGDPSSGRSNLKGEDRQPYPGNRNDPWNALLGYYLQRELIASTGDLDRGLKRARFAVLETLDAPGALLELGFLTNPMTAARLKDPAYRDRLAGAVVRGVEMFRRTTDRLRAPAANGN